MKSVTILSTVRNIHETVNGWLESLLIQDYPGKYDIVIIDGGSTDDTVKILESYQKLYGNISLVQYTSTQPQAFNYAIKNKLISNEIVALIDGDCIAPKNWLSSLVATMEQNNVDAVGGPGLTPENSNLLQKVIGFDLDYRFLKTPEGLIKRQPNMNLMVKTGILEQLKFNENLPVGYDADFCYRLNESGYTLWFSPSVIVWHHHRSSIKGYIKQQFLNGKYALKYNLEVNKKLKGDNINPLNMTLQPVFLAFALASAVLWLIDLRFLLLTGIFALSLGLLFSMDIVKAYRINRNPYVVLLYPLYLLRLIAWVFGAIAAVLRYITVKQVQQSN